MGARLHINIPSPFLEAWIPLLELSGAVLELPRPNGDEWVLLALARKAARSMYALASLASLNLWGDALVIGRSLFETELRVQWLLAGPYDERVSEYLNEVGTEEARLQRKGRAGRSVSAKVLAATRVVGGPATSSGGKARHNIRETAKPLDMERLYDLPYWISSTFVHTGVLSLAEWHHALARADRQLAAMFSLGHRDLPCWLTLSGVPTSAIRTYRAIDDRLALGLGSRIGYVHKLLGEAVSRTSGVKFDPRVAVGEIVIGSSPDDPNAVRFSPNRD